jgi:hypothetical protein
VRRLTAFGSSATLHAVMLALAIWWSLPPILALRSSRRSSARAVSTFIVGSTEDSAYPGVRPTEPPREDWSLPPDGSSAEVSMGDFNINVAKVAAHAQVLFPFLAPGLALDHFGVMPERATHETLTNPFARSAAQASARAKQRPLLLDRRALQVLVDKAWSRRDRWTVFQSIAKLIGGSDPDAGGLPQLLQMYREENWPQPYADRSIRDPRLWVELELAADHVNFVGFVSRYATAHPGTRATTELLLLLDDIAQASQDAFATLIKTDPNESLEWTRRKNAAAFDLVVRLRRYYGSVLERKGLTDATSVSRYYDGVRLGILDAIMRTTPNGYRVNDARFLIGAIYWRQGRLREAVEWWQPMTPDPGDLHAAAYAEILHAVNGSVLPDADDRQIERAIGGPVNRALETERGRWLMFSFDRLEQFGHRFDTF